MTRIQRINTDLFITKIQLQVALKKKQNQQYNYLISFKCYSTQKQKIRLIRVICVPLFTQTQPQLYQLHLRKTKALEHG